MGGPSGSSSDILGIEVGRCALRGVRLDQDTTQVTAAAECTFTVDAVAADGVIDPMIFGPRLEDLLDRLEVRDRSQCRVGFTIGPRNAGVGSGPAMANWLETQAVSLQEPMTHAGDLGIAFVPSRAVDAAVKLASGAGVDLVRIDFSPVAAARAIGEQVDDLICVGSGQGWQARMRDFEVLEAMENSGIGLDDPLTIFAPNGNGRSIDRYGWVEIAPELAGLDRLDIGQLAPAVGVAIGIVYESSANLLTGSAVGCTPHRSAPAPLALLADVDLATHGAEATLRLQPRQLGPVEPARREVRHVPTTALSPLRAGARRPAARPTGRHDEPPRLLGLDDPAGALDEDDPITMFSPDTDVEEIMGQRDRRLSVDVLIGLLVVSAIALLVAYLLL